MWPRRLKEIFAVTTIGTGTAGLNVSREHSLLPIGPQGANKVARFFADNPNYVSLLGLSQIGFGTWPALRQYREG